MEKDVQEFLDYVEHRNQNEPEFLQAVQEVAETVIPYIEDNEKYRGKRVLKRMTEPERVIIFRITWIDDKGNIRINRGFRIEMSFLP